MKMKPLIYTDTSVIGGVYDTEFNEWSKKIINEFEKGSKIIVISDLTLKELDQAPIQVKNVIKKIPRQNKKYVRLNDEAIRLADKYISEGKISNKYIIDTNILPLPH